MHWLNKYKLAKGCDVCGYGRIKHGLQAVLAKGLDWAHIDPLTKSSVMWGKNWSMYRMIARVVKDPVKNRQYRRELFDELKKCRLLCKLCHIAESHERNESIAGHALSAVRKNEPVIVGDSASGRGGELFVPNSSGQIIPNSRLGSGGGVNVNFNINTVDASGFEELLVRSRGTITQLINNAVNEKGRSSII